MVTVKFGERAYELQLDEQLKTLTGAESMLVEDYLGGWVKFQSPANLTRTTIVIIWLAKRAAGETTTFEEIATTPGLLFGDAFDLTDDKEGDPEDPTTEPGRPLAETNGASEPNDGSGAAASTAETSANTGPPLSHVSTG